MKIFIVFALALCFGLAHGMITPESSVQDINLEDTAITEKTETSKIKIGIGIMITGILLFILVLILTFLRDFWINLDRNNLVTLFDLMVSD